MFEVNMNPVYMEFMKKNNVEKGGQNISILLTI